MQILQPSFQKDFKSLGFLDHKICAIRAHWTVYCPIRTALLLSALLSKESDCYMPCLTQPGLEPGDSELWDHNIDHWATAAHKENYQKRTVVHIFVPFAAASASPLPLRCWLHLHTRSCLAFLMETKCIPKHTGTVSKHKNHQLPTSGVNLKWDFMLQVIEISFFLY